MRTPVSALLGLLACAAFVMPGPAISAPTPPSPPVPPKKPLVVKIRTYDGQPRLEVRRRVSYIIGCSKHCRIRVETRLRSPDFNLGTTNAFNGKPNTPTSLSFGVPRQVLRYMRVYPANVILVARVTAKDYQTGKLQKKRRVFKFKVR